MGIISKSILCAESESSHIKGQSYQDFAEKWLFWLCLRLCVELKIIPPSKKQPKKLKETKEIAGSKIYLKNLLFGNLKTTFPTDGGIYTHQNFTTLSVGCLAGTLQPSILVLRICETSCPGFPKVLYLNVWYDEHSAHHIEDTSNSQLASIRIIFLDIGVPTF